MAYTLSPKPIAKTPINWVLAPASLVGCQPLIEGEDPITTLEYVSGLSGDANTFIPNTFGSTTWASYGVNMSGGGVAGARGVGMPLSVLATFDPHRRTFAWAQRTLSVLNTSTFFNGEAGALSHFSIQVPGHPSIDPDPTLVLNFGIRTTPPEPGTDHLTALSPTTVINEWHSFVMSWSDGTGTDPTTGMRIWCDGVLLAYQSNEPRGATRRHYDGWSWQRGPCRLRVLV